MSIRIYAKYVGLDVLYIHVGNQLFEACNPHHPVATIVGGYIYYSARVDNTPSATLYKDGFIYAGAADQGHPIGYTNGKELMDKPGYSPVLSAEEYDPEGLAMGCILRYNDDDLRFQYDDGRAQGSTDAFHGDFCNTPGNNHGGMSGAEYMNRSRQNSMDPSTSGRGMPGFAEACFGNQPMPIQFSNNEWLLEAWGINTNNEGQEDYIDRFLEKGWGVGLEYLLEIDKIQMNHYQRRKKLPMWRRKMRLWGVYARVPLIFAVVGLGICLIFSIIGIDHGRPGLATIMALTFAIISYIVGKLCIICAVEAAKESIYEYDNPGHLEGCRKDKLLEYDFDNPPNWEYLKHKMGISSEE